MAWLTAYLSGLVVAALVGTGLMAGLLFAFSNFVMRALLQMAPASGMEAMQRINISILNPVFFLLFVGTTLLCVLIALTAVSHLPQPGMAYCLVASVCYLLGPVGVTLLCNVPLNNALATQAVSMANEVWSSYALRWQMWNHVRTILAVLASLFFAMGLVARS